MAKVVGGGRLRHDAREASSDGADAKPFDDWFDLNEAGLRTMVRGFIETTIEEEGDTALARRAMGA